MRTFLALVLALACGSALAHPSPKADRGYERIEANEPAPAFTLSSQDAKRVSLKDLRGTPVVLTFLYTTCTNVCPVLLHTMTAAERRLGEAELRNVRFVGVTVDPKRDTPERLKVYMKERGLDAARWLLLTGSLAEATRVAIDYGVVVRPAPHGDFVHNSVFVVIDAQGRIRAELHGMATPPAALADELRKLIEERRK